MSQKNKSINKTNDPQTARFLRKQMQKEGVDFDEEQEDAIFKFNPSQSIDKFGKKQTQKNLQKQIEYFGYKIEPFHMKNQQMMGEIDEDGYFVFNERGRGKNRDAWLQSVRQSEDVDIADALAKKIKTESRFKTVYEANSKINEDLRENEENEGENENEQEEEGSEKQQKEEQRNEDEQNGLSVQELLELMISFLPNEKINANKYMKGLKAEKNMQEYNRLLTISNEYIEKTGQYDILTKKKGQLEEILEQIRERNNEPQLNWNEDQSPKEAQAQLQPAQKQSENDEDDIF